MNLEKAKLDPPLHFPDWPAALAATGWLRDQQAAVSKPGPGMRSPLDK